MDIDPPHSVLLEQAILSVVLDGRWPDSWHIVKENCPTRDYFFVRNHQLLWMVCDDISKENKHIDAQTVTEYASSISFDSMLDRLKGKKYQNNVDVDRENSLTAGLGGSSAIGDIAAVSSHMTALPDNCESLAQLYRKRKMLIAFSEGIDRIVTERNPDTVGNSAISAISSIISHKKTTTDTDGLNQSTVAYHDKLEASKEDIRTGTFGISELDEFIPLRAGRLITTAAAPGCGKTSLALMAAVSTAKKLGPYSVGFASMEMSGEELSAINLSREAQVPKQAIENGKLSRGQRISVEATIEEMKAYPFYILDTTKGSTVEAICSWIHNRKVTSGGKLHLVCVDYIQLIDAKNARQSEREILVEASRAFKVIARELHICVLMLSQMNSMGTKQERDKYGKLQARPEPRLEDLHGSSTIGKDSDCVVFITPKSANNHNATIDVIFKIAKNRGGREGQFEAEFRRADGQRFVATCETGKRDVPNRTQRMESAVSDSEDAFAG